MTTSLAEIVEMSLAEFLAMPPAPGHRDSEGRANKAKHLHVFIPEHTSVEVAEYTDAGANLCRARMTGNTRAQVWKCGLSDRKPEKVQARVYRMKDEKEVRERMLLHDSPEAAWNSKDYVYRALDMTFAGNWTPTSKALKGGKFVGAVRLANWIIRGRWSASEKGEKVETVMPDWQRELKEVDAALDSPIAPQIAERKPFQQGFIAGCLLISRYRSEETLRKFIALVLDDSGTKDDEGADGVQALVDYLARNRAGGPAEINKQMIVHVISCFNQWESGKRSKSIKKLDPIEWHQTQRHAALEARRASPDANSVKAEAS